MRLIHSQNPSEPPVPASQLYPKTAAAIARQATPKRLPWWRRMPPETWIPSVAVLAIVIVALLVVWNDSPARDAADAAAVPSAHPGPPVPQRQTEYAPGSAEVIPGDGTWLITKEIKRGTYRSEGGFTCYWARLRNLSNELDGIIANGYARPGPQVVAMGKDDVALSTSGCGSWVLVK